MANNNHKNHKNHKNNKSVIIIICLSILLAISGIALVIKGRSGTGQSDPVPIKKSDTNQAVNSSSVDANDQVASKNGYVSLSEYQANKSAYSAGKVVLFFNARWCPTCKVLDESLKKQASKFPADLTVVDVDYDNSADLIKQYKIAYQHVLVQIDADGKEIIRWAGGGDLQSITDQLK